MSDGIHPPLLDETPLSSPHFVIGPAQHERVGMPILISLIPAGRDGVWLVVGKPGLITRDLASLALAICVLQRGHPFLLPTLTAPSQQICIVAIRSNGEWTDHRRIRYPDKILAAVEQLRSTIGVASSRWIDEMESALNGRRPSGWSGVPSDLNVHDPNNELSMLLQLPIDLANVDWLQATFETMGALVKHDYERDRYLQNLSLGELKARASEALLNCYELTAPGRWSINPFDKVQGRAFVRLEEALHEAELRQHGGASQLLKGATQLGLMIGAGHDWSCAERFFEKQMSGRTPMLARFGERAHLELSHSQGVFRLSPASAYSDTHLGSARFDTELVAVEEMDIKRAKISVVDPDTGEETPLTALRATQRSRAETDALLLCFSGRVSPRHFQDFAAQACLVIHDLKEFMVRVRAATTRELPGWSIWSGDIQYYDPFSRKASFSVPLYCKTIGYAYQQEYRLMWIPPVACEQVDVRMLSIRSIEDISELVTL